MVHYAASSGNSLQTFRENLSVPYSRVKGRKPEITQGFISFQNTSSFYIGCSVDVFSFQRLCLQHNTCAGSELRVDGRC